MRALRKVLVVDDDPVVGRSFERVLAEKGYAVSTALDGPQALKKLAEEDYDVVYTDIRMPGMDGIEVAKQVRAKRPWVPVVIITGYGNAGNAARAKEAGVSAFLRKPLSPETIEGSARDALFEKALAVAAPVTAVAAAPELVAAEIESMAKNVALRLKNIALFFAAPFVGLLYVLTFPFIGLAMLAWTGARAVMRRSDGMLLFARNVALFLAAPFVGLVYILVGPFVGLGVLLWMGARALVARLRLVSRVYDNALTEVAEDADAVPVEAKAEDSGRAGDAADAGYGEVRVAAANEASARKSGAGS